MKMKKSRKSNFKFNYHYERFISPRQYTKIFLKWRQLKNSLLHKNFIQINIQVLNSKNESIQFKIFYNIHNLWNPFCERQKAANAIRTHHRNVSMPGKIHIPILGQL